MNLGNILLAGWLAGEEEEDFERALRSLETAQAALIAGDLSRAVSEASEARLLGQRLALWNQVLGNHVMNAATEVLQEVSSIRPSLMPEEFPTSIIPREAGAPWTRIQTPRRGSD